MLSTQELLARARDFLASFGIPKEEAEHEARLILAHLFGCAPLEVYFCSVDEKTSERFWSYIKERTKGVPLAYLLGEANFFGHTFKVAPGVLIPRPETELLVEEALKLSPENGKVLELGVGSGCISLTLALERPDLLLTGVEISNEALKIAGANRQFHALEERVFLIQGDWFSPLKPGPHFDLIVSNPPYVSVSEWPELSPEVRDFEPPPALLGGERGLDFIFRTLEEAPLYLKPGSFLLLEIGYGQAEEVARKASECGYEFYFLPDLSGIKRVFVGRALAKN